MQNLFNCVYEESSEIHGNVFLGGGKNCFEVSHQNKHLPIPVFYKPFEVHLYSLYRQGASWIILTEESVLRERCMGTQMGRGWKEGLEMNIKSYTIEVT